ncbi:hypothetical protein ACSQ67_006120 [Phaseolus vulgaris]
MLSRVVSSPTLPLLCFFFDTTTSRFASTRGLRVSSSTQGLPHFFFHTTTFAFLLSHYDFCISSSTLRLPHFFLHTTASCAKLLLPRYDAQVSPSTLQRRNFSFHLTFPQRDQVTQSNRPYPQLNWINNVPNTDRASTRHRNIIQKASNALEVLKEVLDAINTRNPRDLLLIRGNFEKSSTHFLTKFFADDFQDLVLLQHFSRNVERKVLGIHNTLNKAEILRNQLFTVVHDEDSRTYSFNGVGQ